MEVKSNVEAAKRLVACIKQTNLQSRLTKTLKQTSTCFYTYREMIGSVIEAWEELECLLDARNKLKYLEDINKILLIQTSHALKPLHNCGLELKQDKKPMLHRVLFWEAKLKLAFCENERSRSNQEMIGIGRRAIKTKLLKSISIFHEVAAQLDRRVTEIEDQGKRNKVYKKISGIYDRITGDQSGIETCVNC